MRPPMRPCLWLHTAGDYVRFFVGALIAIAALVAAFLLLGH